jgi:hypothetical protein
MKTLILGTLFLIAIAGTAQPKIVKDMIDETRSRLWAQWRIRLWLSLGIYSQKILLK